MTSSIIALGMSVDLNRFPGLPEHALTMKNLSDAHRLRTHVISCLEMADVATEPELKRELLTFVVVGAGFTGVETVAEVNDLIHRALKYYPNIKHEEINVYLIEYADRILPTFPADLAEYATKRLRMHGIDVKTGVGTKSATSTAVELGDGSLIPTRTIVATIGNGPNRLVASLDLDMQWGRVKTDRFMRVVRHDGIWAVGDAALIPLVEQPAEDPLHYAPQTAQFAVREGRQLARQSDCQGERRGAQALRLYVERLACLARHEQGRGRGLRHQALRLSRLAACGAASTSPSCRDSPPRYACW